MLLKMSAIRIAAFAAALLLAGAACGTASAYTLKTLHVFCTNAQCPDGWAPIGAPVPDGHGNLFGVTSLGGNGQNAGTIYELTPKKHGNWKFQTLYDFCSQASCADGTHPLSMLVVDVSGNLYGTTYQGGSTNTGVAFKFTPRNRRSGVYRVVHNFCSLDDCADGAGYRKFAYAGDATGALYDGTSALYGAGATAGPTGSGVISQFIPGKPWKVSIIYRFCQVSGCPDGQLGGGLIGDANGNLFGQAGSTEATDNLGTVFELSPAGQGSWTETTLYQFCPGASVNCKNGKPGGGTMVIDASGNLLAGGGGGHSKHCFFTDGYGCGTLFKVVPNGTASTESVLYDFCSKIDCRDGATDPNIASDHVTANLFGTTPQGGGNDGDIQEHGGGVVFEYSGGQYSVVYAFCALANCADGAYPAQGVSVDSSGAIFGATISGGVNRNGQGTLFELVP